MLIPIRCFTCGKVLANKWKTFQEKAKEIDDKVADDNDDEQTFQNFQRGLKGKVLDELGLTKICCRRHMLSHVDLIDII